MTTYRFAPLPPSTAVVVTDAAGETVDEGTTGADGSYTATLDPGVYLATSQSDPWTTAHAAPIPPGSSGGASITTPSVGFWGDHATVDASATSVTNEVVVLTENDISNPDDEDPILAVNIDGNLVVVKAGLYALSLTGSAEPTDVTVEGTVRIKCLSEDESLIYYETTFDMDANPDTPVSTLDIVEAFTSNAFLPWGEPGLGGWTWFTFTQVAFTAGQVLKTQVNPGSESTTFSITYDIYPILLY